MKTAAQTSASAPSSAEGFLATLECVDLSMVKRKLMDEEEGQGWTEEHAAFVERRYRRYLCMLYLQPDKSPVPTADIDTFWHQHILDTHAYARDCERVFGYFVHHYPYFGMRDEQDAADLQNSFEETKVSYRQLFGEDYCVEFDGDHASKCHKGCSKCHTCKSGCSGIQCKTCTKK